MPPPMHTTAYIALGGNLGDRRHNLNEALRLLGQQPGVTVVRHSTYHETDPVGGPAGQGKYLNAAAELHTSLSADELLHVLLGVEQALGRVRHERDGPRTLDLDLLLYGTEVRADAILTLPHPRMEERLFVLQPLTEIAADMVHPTTGLSVRQLLERLDRRGQLAGLRAVVTGASSGIGQAIALRLAAAGADVIVHGRRSRAALEAVARDIAARGVRASVLQADLADPEQCRSLVGSAWDLWNGVDIWINNAGADTLTGAASQWSFETKLSQLLAVDVVATLLLSRAIGERMKEKGGVIVNMGWDQAETGMEGDSGQLFGTAKAAVMGFSKSLALTLAPRVRVNCLAPGWIRTAWGENASRAWQERVERETPLRRWGEVDDVAAAALWLVSPAAAFITGQVIRVNGGAVR